MPRYIKKLTQLGSLGPTEERNPGLWVGYDIDLDADLSAHGLTRVDDWTEDELAARGVTRFLRVDPESLGLETKR